VLDRLVVRAVTEQHGTLLKRSAGGQGVVRRLLGKLAQGSCFVDQASSLTDGTLGCFTNFNRSMRRLAPVQLGDRDGRER
jgi:hypothetical protein